MFIKLFLFQIEKEENTINTTWRFAFKTVYLFCCLLCRNNRGLETWETKIRLMTKKVYRLKACLNIGYAYYIIVLYYYQYVAIILILRNQQFMLASLIRGPFKWRRSLIVVSCVAVFHFFNFFFLWFLPGLRGFTPTNLNSICIAHLTMMKESPNKDSFIHKVSILMSYLNNTKLFTNPALIIVAVWKS